MKRKGQYVEFSISNLNVTKLFNKFNREGVEIFNVKNADHRLSFCANLNDNEKILAILRNSLYNDIRIQKHSVGNYVKKHICFLIGIAIFLVVAYMPLFFIFNVSVQCEDLAVLDKINKELIEYRNDGWVKKNEIDTNEIKSKIFNIDNVSFCEVTIKGGTLYIFAKTNLVPDIVVSKNQIKATADGKISRIIVTSGRAVVKVGDVVKAGDLLIDGKITIEGVEGEINTSAVGKVFINSVYETIEIVENEETQNAVAKFFEIHLVETRGGKIKNQVVDIKEIDGKSQVTLRTEFEKLIGS